METASTHTAIDIHSENPATTILTRRPTHTRRGWDMSRTDEPKPWRGAARCPSVGCQWQLLIIGTSEEDLNASVNAANEAHARIIHPDVQYVPNAGLRVDEGDPVEIIDNLKRSVEAQGPGKDRVN